MALPRIFRYEHYPKIPKKRKLQVFQISDVHLGAKTHIQPAFEDMIEKIRKTRFTKAILHGDLIEHNTKSSIGEGVYEQLLTPQDQKQRIIEILKPIRNKIIGISRGNHEKRASTNEGIDIVDDICMALDVPRLLSHSLHRFNFDEKNHTLLVTHGRTGASTLGGKVNAVEKLVHIYGADAYLYGHVHHLTTWQSIIYGIDGIKLRHFGINGSFMDYVDSYAQESEYRPGMPGYITCMIGHDEIKLDLHPLLDYMGEGLVYDEKEGLLEADI